MGMLPLPVYLVKNMIKFYVQIIARWHPGEGRLPDLLEAPVYYPTEEVLFFPSYLSPLL